MFEFDEESEEGRLSVSDIRLLEQLKQQQCIVLSEQESTQACAVLVTQADVLFPPCTQTASHFINISLDHRGRR